MRQNSKLKLEPTYRGEESFGQRLAWLRKAKGYTQDALAKKIGIIQRLVSDYEADKLRPYHEMIVRFSEALEVTTDELLGVKESKNSGLRLSLKLLRRMKKIEELPAFEQKILLTTIDIFLKGAERKDTCAAAAKSLSEAAVCEQSDETEQQV